MALLSGAQNPLSWWRVLGMVVFCLSGTAVSLYNAVNHRFGDQANILLGLIFAGLAVGVLRNAAKQRQGQNKQ